MPDQKTRKAYAAINKVADELASRGVYLPDAYKRRDPREPERVAKEMFEDDVAKLFNKLFAVQSKELEKFLRSQHLARKAHTDPPAELFSNEEIEAAILAILVTMAQAGVAIFDSQVEIGFSLAVYNAAAADWARKHAGLLIKNINKTTLKAVQEAIALFIETPGMTIGQLMDMLPFGKVRSRLIAVDQVTNVFAEAELIAAERLQKEFPDVDVIGTWFTNNDPNVCIICEGLDGEKAKVGKKFMSRTTKGKYIRPGGPPKGPHIGDRCWVTYRTVISA